MRWFEYLGLRRPNPVGAPQAHDPDSHLGDDPPKVMDALTDEGDEFTDTLPPIAQQPRTFRAGYAAQSGTGGGQIALGTEKAAAAAVHLDRGPIDARRNDLEPSGNPAAPEAPYAPGVESPHNDRDAVRIDHGAPPSRARQGFTGADPARAAETQRAYLIRPFDKGIAEHPGPVEKVDQQSPQAARPPERKRLVGGRPSAGGTTGTGMEPVGPLSRASHRIIPKAWDDGDEPVIQASNESLRRRGGWRA